MVSRRGLAPPQIERVVRLLRRRMEEVHDGNLSRLAKELGIAQSSLWEIVHRGHPPSRATVESLARLLDRSVESILTSPRERAAGIARESGVSEAALSAAMSEPDDESMTVLEWIDRIRAFATLREKERARAPSRGAA